MKTITKLNPTPEPSAIAPVRLQRGVMLRRVAESATQAYRDTLENVCRPHSDQMARRPFDPIPLANSERRLIENMRLQAQHAIERYDSWLAQHNIVLGHNPAKPK